MASVLASSSSMGCKLSSNKYSAGSSMRLPKQRSVAVFAVDAGRPLLKKPDLKKPERTAEPAKKLFDEGSPESSPTSSSVATATEPSSLPAATIATSSSQGTITIEYQRQRAKELTKYFKDKKIEEQLNKAQVFGWTPKNEITNGRWVMFGFAVGLLTEYATGVDFIDQLKLMITYLGLADLE